MFTTEHKLVALLEMASEAEALHRNAQAEHLYKRASVVARMTLGADHATTLAILWDIARVCEQQDHGDEADFYYNRACAVGFFSQLSNVANVSKAA